MKQGFALIELLIALFIASGIALLLTNSLFQVYRSVGVVEDRADSLTQVCLINDVIKKDIAGVCIPISVLEQEKQEEKEKEKAKQPPNPAMTQAPPAVEQKKEKQKPLEKIMYSVNKDNQLSLLTFITNNPQQAYWDKKVGKAVPFIARVIYRLEPDKRFSTRNKTIYRLMRQQGYALDFDEYKDEHKGPGRAYPLIENIKSCTVEYSYFEQEDKKEEEKNKKPVLKKKREWNDKQESDAKDKEKKHLLPAIMHLAIEFWDTDMVTWQEYQFAFEIPIIEYKEPKKEEAKKAPDEKKDEQKQPPAKPTPTAPKLPNMLISHDVRKTIVPATAPAGRPA